MKKTNSTVRKNRIPESKQIESVMDYINKKKSISTIAFELNVSDQTVRNWVKKYKNSAQADPIPAIENITDYVYTNIIPTPLVYTLEEAASVAKISTNQLLHYAVLGKITLFFDRPIDVLVMSEKDVDLAPKKYPPPKMQPFMCDKSLQDFYENLDEAFYDRNFNCFKYNFLAISQDECNKLEMGVIIRSYKFDSIYFVNKNNELIHNKPISDKDGMGKIQDFYYAFKEDFVKNNKYIDIQKNHHAIDISKGMLRVSSKELSQLVSNEINRNSKRKPSQEQFAVHENKSSLLVDLDQAAFEIWGDFNPIRAAQFNTPEIVSDYLVSKFNFHRLHANQAAVMILPSKSNSIRNRELPYRADILQTLIDGWQAICLEHSFVNGQKTLYDNRSCDWLYAHSLTLAKNQAMLSSASKIILSENAPFHNPRKPKSKI